MHLLTNRLSRLEAANLVGSGASADPPNGHDLSLPEQKGKYLNHTICTKRLYT